MPTMSDAATDRDRDLQQLSAEIDEALFDTIAAHRAPPGLYPDDKDVRKGIEDVLIDALGRFFGVGIEEDTTGTERARVLARILQLATFARGYGLQMESSDTATRH
jgi:hypothetical protein